MRVGLVRKAHAVQEAVGEALGPTPWIARGITRGASATFSQTRRCGKQVELLEDHPDPGPEGVEVPVPGAYGPALEPDFARVRNLKEVEAAEERRLSRAAGP